MDEELTDEGEGFAAGEDAGPSGAPAELIVARPLIKTLVGTLKARNFYPHDSPLLKEYQATLNASFRDFFHAYPALTVTIGESSFSVGGHVVYANPDLRVSLPFLLYNDGLRELSFRDGLEDWEIEALVEIMHETEAAVSPAEDIVIRMWEREFEHIDYVAVDDVREDTALFEPYDDDRFRRRLIQGPTGYVGADLLDMTQPREAGGAAAQAEKADSVISLGFMAGSSVLTLTPEEWASLHGEIEQETSSAFVFRTGNILLEILQQTRDQQDFAAALDGLLGVHDAMIALREFGRAVRVLQQVQGLADSGELQAWQVLPLRRFLEGIGEEHRIERMDRILRLERDLPLADLKAYLMLLPGSSVPQLVQTLAETETIDVRWMICDALAGLGDTVLDGIMPMSGEGRWYLLRNIALILGRIGNERAAPYLIETFAHPDVRVKMEVVRALGAVGGEQATSFLGQALKERDAAIRSAAALSLGKIGTPQALAPLLVRVRSFSFPWKEPEEIRAIFQGVAHARSNEALPALGARLTSPLPLLGEKAGLVRQAAADALAMIGTPEAEQALRAGQKSRRAQVRDACDAALQRMRLMSQQAREDEADSKRS